MATGRIHSAKVTTALNPSVVGRLHSANAVAAPTADPVYGRVHSLAATAQSVVPDPVYARIHSVAAVITPIRNSIFGRLHSATVVAGAVIDAGQDKSVEPWSLVSFEASAIPNADKPYEWEQVSGPHVTLYGEGRTRTYYAPADVLAQTIVFKAKYGSTSDTVTHTVMPATERAVTNGKEVPLRILDTKDLQLGLTITLNETTGLGVIAPGGYKDLEGDPEIGLYTIPSQSRLKDMNADGLYTLEG